MTQYMRKISTLLLATFSLQIINAQNVGVDVATPLEKLDVAGGIRIGTTNNTNAGTIRFISPNFEGYNGSAWIPLSGGNDNDWTISGSNQYSSVSGNVGVGITAPVSKLHVYSTIANENGGFRISNSTATAAIYLNSGNDLVIRKLLHPDQLVIDDGGNIGVGTSTPLNKLHVAGSIQMVDGNQQAGYVPASDVNGKMTWTNINTLVNGLPTGTSGQTLRHNGTNWVANSNLYHDGTNVGIGTTPSGVLLDITGTNAGTTSLQLRSGNTGSGTNSNQLAFGFNGTENYRHAIKTRHNSLGQNNNAIDFYVWDYATQSGTPGAIGTKQVMTIAADGGGRVGVGTTTPAQKLDVQGSIQMVDGNQAAGRIPVSDANGRMTWTDPLSMAVNQLRDADNDTKIQVEENADEDKIRFDTDGIERMIIDNNGRIGIGTSSPGSAPSQYAALDIRSDDPARSDIYQVGSQSAVPYHVFIRTGGTLASPTAIGNGAQIGAITAQIYNGSGYYESAGIRMNVDGTISGDSPGTIGFHTTPSGSTTGVRRMTIKNDGKIGIGTDTPGSRLTISGAESSTHGLGAAIELINSAAGGANWYLRSGATGTQTPAGGFSISNNSGYHFTIDATGNMGVGLNTPASKLHVKSATQDDTGGLRISTNSANSVIYHNTDNDLVIKKLDQPDQLVLDVFGNVGIGTNTPDRKLTVNGAIRMIDGNQQAGYIPVSDASGKMTWTDPTSVSIAPANKIIDSDNDTKIQVEENSDEDIIRFDVAGVEQLIIKNNASGAPLFDPNSINGNLYFGKNSGQNDVGSFNTFVGQYSGSSNVAGSENTIIGSDAGRSNTSGSNNTFLGAKAGFTNTGSGNVFIGSSSGYSVAGGSNKLYIDNSSTGSPLIYGEFDNDLIRVNGSFEVWDNFSNAGQFVATIRNSGNGGYSNGLQIRAGQNSQTVNNRFISFVRPDGTEIGAVRQTSSSGVDFWSSSDLRRKTNITPTARGLEDLMKLEVKDYVFKDDLDKLQTGFIAQEVYKIFPNAVSVGGDDEKTDPWMMNYGKLTPLLVKAVQDLTKIVEEQQQRIAELEQK